MHDRRPYADTVSSDFVEAPAKPGAGLEPPPADGTPQVVAGPYRVAQFIGAGGFGCVYQAVDQRLEKLVALKVLSSERSRTPSAIKRFRAEALAASHLSHPNIVAVTDFDVLPDGRPFLVMEHVMGETLAQVLARRSVLPPLPAARVAQGICGALSAAHVQGVVHRDLKPANVMIGPDEENLVVKVLDFGVAKLALTPESESLTGAGQLLGTPAYMAPEQVRPSIGPLDGRADLYALGIVLYEMLTGATPFAGRPPTDVLLAQVMEEPQPPSAHRPDVPRALEAIVLRATRKRPEERTPTAACSRGGNRQRSRWAGSMRGTTSRRSSSSSVRRIPH
jgi:serine/threonine-protein kinase